MNKQSQRDCFTKRKYKYRPKFAVEGLLRADSATRSGFYTNMIQNGVMTRNEVRDLEDLAPLPGGDELMVQMQMVGLKDQGKTSG